MKTISAALFLAVSSTAVCAGQGNWVIIGATGGLAGIAGGGDFTNATNRETGAQSLSLTGAVTTK